MRIEQADKYREAIIELLTSEKLPVADLPERLNDFVVALQNEGMTGAAGLEVYGVYGLLRSLAVRPESRGKGVAGRLLQKIDAMALLKNLKELYLLTETAPGYFERKGYHKISRDDVPAEVQQSSEFNHVCPVSAIVMKKSLR
jgi:amino-acid N-acetyltransferase